jgi:uncharacterized protein YndB with AHSA1/START domain
MSTNSTAQDQMADGTVEEISDGRHVLRFERRFAHPVERVWNALTRPDRITEWFGEGKVVLELVEGGRYDIEVTGPPELVEAIVEVAGAEYLTTRDTVLQVEPMAVFEHTFGGSADSVVRWDLQPDGDGCRLSLTHTLTPGPEMGGDARALAGWHTCLERMGRSLDGKPVTWRRARWEEHHAHYGG